MTTKPTVVAVLQARCSSSRLPGKVLKPILGEPMLFRQIERVRRATLIDRLIVATSVEKADDALAGLCRERGVECYRGDLDDVLDRFYQAARVTEPDHVVRLTGDCPLADPELIDRVVRFHLEGGYDYSSNTIVPSFPDGLDVEVFRFDALAAAWKEADLPSQREHVTPFIHQQPERFRLGNLTGATDLSALRWTVDEPDDFELVSRLYQALYPQNPCFGTAEILACLEAHPELATLNTHHDRNEGFLKSLRADRLAAERRR